MESCRWWKLLTLISMTIFGTWVNVLSTGFVSRQCIADCNKKEIENAILKYQNPARTDCQEMPETEDFGAKLLKHFVGPDSWTFSELQHGKKLSFLTKRVQKWSTEESYLLLEEAVVPIRVVDDCAERSLGLVTDYHIDWISRSEEQKFHLHQVATELRSKDEGNR